MRALILCAVFLPGSAWAAAGDAKRGEVSYQKRCSQCHGATGKADGPAALFMLPRPRLLADNAAYKFRTTTSGELPTDQDLFTIITRGLPGSAMPDFAGLPEQERWDLVAYVKSLTEDFADPDMTKTAVPMPELVTAKPLPSTPASITRGQEIYKANKCFQCHGEHGRGNGESWNTLKDVWGTPILPANLTLPDTFRGGLAPADIYRIFSTGVLTMPSYAESITPADRWHLVNYVLSLSPPPKPAPDEKIEAVRVEVVPAAEAAWAVAPVARFRTLSNVVEPPRLFWPTVDLIMAQAVYTDREVALRLQWDDRSQSTGTDVTTVYQDRDTTIYNQTQHPDQLAVQFPARAGDKAKPYFFFGDTRRPAYLWWWRSDRPKILEMNAKGSASLAYQDPESQELTGQVTYDDGRYTMVVRRALATLDLKNDVQLAPGVFVPIAFHAWDGKRGELGNRHALTTWYWLYLVPPVPPTAYVAPPVFFTLTLGVLVGIVALVRRRAKS